MWQPPITADDFVLKPSWTCTVTYYYDSSGNHTSTTTGQSDARPVSNDVLFPVSLPPGTKIRGAKVHSAHTTGLHGGAFRVNGKNPDSDGFVELDTFEVVDGCIAVTFTWTAYRDSTTAHNGEAPAYTGTSSQTVTKSHNSPSTVSEVYLLIDTVAGGCIYHAENGELVPYQLYHAEDGVLVPYQIQHAEDGALAPYGG